MKIAVQTMKVGAYYISIAVLRLELLSRDLQGQVSSQFYILGYYEDGLEQGGHLNDEDALEGNEGVFKVPSLPPELTGNGLKKKKLKSKGIMTKRVSASVAYSNS